MPRPKFLSYTGFALGVVFYALAAVASVLAAYLIVGVLMRVL